MRNDTQITTSMLTKAETHRDRPFSQLSSHVKIKAISVEIKKNRNWTPLNSSARQFQPHEKTEEDYATDAKWWPNAKGLKQEEEEQL